LSLWCPAESVTTQILFLRGSSKCRSLCENRESLSENNQRELIFFRLSGVEDDLSNSGTFLSRGRATGSLKIKT